MRLLPTLLILLSLALASSAAAFLPAAIEQEFGDAALELRNGYAREVPASLRRNALIEHSGLSAEDWDRLADARDIDVVSALVIKALRSRVRSLAADPPS